MPYYKDTLNGLFPMFSAVPLDDVRFVEINESEWDRLRQGDASEDHPYSPYVLNREGMAEASRDHVPPAGTRLLEPASSDHPNPEIPAVGVIHEEGR